MRTLPDIKDLLEPLERAISDVLIPSLTEHNCSVAERKLLALPARMGGLGMTNPPESAMICQRGGLVIQRHDEIRDLEAELLDMVCHDVAIEPTLQPLAGEDLNRGANTAPNARLDVDCRGFWERQRAAFFDVGYVTRMRTRTKLSPKQIYKLHEDEKKRKYASRIIEVENGTCTPLVFTTTGGMSQECQRYIPGLPSSSLQRSRKTTPQKSHGSERGCPSPSCGLP